MGLLNRIGMVSRSNVTAMATAAEDPEKIVERSITDIQENLGQLRQTIANLVNALESQKQNYSQNIYQAQEWAKQAVLALQKGDENLAREALSRKKTYADLAATLKVGLDQQTGQVETLKKNLIVIEGKISEAKTKKEMLKARMQSAEQMEERVLMPKAKASASSELGMDNLESQFAQLEDGNGVDDELAAIKGRLGLGSPAPQDALPPSDAAKPKPSVGAAIDAELEALRRQMG